VYDFGISGKVQQIYPPKGAQEILRAHGELACPAQRLGFPDTDRDATGRSTRAEGHETVRLFVTEQPTSFLAFEQDALRDERQAMPQAGEDWTTASITFVLRRRAASEGSTP
jgi:hypothetical protein